MPVKKTFIFLLGLALFGCSHEKKKIVLEDSFFTVTNLRKTSDIDIDKEFIQMDSLQRRAYFPDLSTILPMDKDFPYSDLFSAYFVSKQEKIGKIQPIVLKGHCDDFKALILVTLNEEQKLVDFLIIDEEEYCGRIDDTSYCERFTHSQLDKNRVVTYDLFRVTGSRPIYSDSIVYERTFDASGHFTARRRLDSVRVVARHGI